MKQIATWGMFMALMSVGVVRAEPSSDEIVADFASRLEALLESTPDKNFIDFDLRPLSSCPPDVQRRVTALLITVMESSTWIGPSGRAHDVSRRAWINSRALGENMTSSQRVGSDHWWHKAGATPSLELPAGATPSIEALRRRILDSLPAPTDRPDKLRLFGPTGTGKTSLGRRPADCQDELLF